VAREAPPNIHAHTGRNALLSECARSINRTSTRAWVKLSRVVRSLSSSRPSEARTGIVKKPAITVCYDPGYRPRRFRDDVAVPFLDTKSNYIYEPPEVLTGSSPPSPHPLPRGERENLAAAATSFLLSTASARGCGHSKLQARQGELARRRKDEGALDQDIWRLVDFKSRRSCNAARPILTIFSSAMSGEKEGVGQPMRSKRRSWRRIRKEEADRNDPTIPKER